ncbi:hypothetical protein G7Y89_g4003 [Cudoniella acicularis]|uniref:Uncharacterized protein n=1 Tax=Cudoniella acicularis TaxID=354080 RepID=A0A8H4RRJ3_9HELO|nr:hypothetical protein G7Y89_g4003 [Cudoniella acicularis]
MPEYVIDADRSGYIKEADIVRMILRVFGLSKEQAGLRGNYIRDAPELKTDWALDRGGVNVACKALPKVDPLFAMISDEI